MLRVLVVDGFDESRAESVAALTAAGHRADGVADDEEATAHLASRRADVIVLDLPIAEVVEAASLVRATTGGRRAKIVALADRADTRDRPRARREGVDFFILRPCPPPALVGHIRRLLTRRAR